MLSVRAKQRVLWILALTAWILADPGESVLAKEAGKGSGLPARQAVKQGVAVEFRIEPLAGKKTDPALEGADAVVQFRLTDAATQTPIKGLRPAAWLDPRTKPTQAKEPPLDCQGKVRAFLQGGLGFRPAVDLNSYYLLALNDGPSISVIDPLLGFGSSKLLTQVLLPSPGEDWVLSGDQNRLYVTLPEANEVAVVDTATWKVIRTIPLAGRPTRLALQPDGKYLWVGRNGDPISDGKAAGASVIDTGALKVATEFPTGSGRHEFAFTADNRYAFVSNERPGTVSVFDVLNLSKVKDLATGAAPVSLAFSALSRTLYVGHADGRVVVIDGQTHEVSARLEADPGLTVLRFSPDGRWAFAASGEKNRIHVFDASTNHLAHTFEVGAGPDQIAFTDHYAYIRARSTQEVTLIQWTALGKEQAVSVARFPAGQSAPGKSAHPAAADAIAPAPEANSVLVANPADKTIYYYGEGMAAPMGSFQNYGSEPRAVRVVDRSLKETAPGVYSAPLRLPQSGTYDVALLVDNPRFEQCHVAEVAPNPDLKQQDQKPLQVEYLLKDRKIRSQAATRLQFKLTDAAGKPMQDDLKDVRVLSLLAPGLWRQRDVARPLGGGVYEVELSAPRPGVYYVSVGCPSLGVRYDQLPNLILHATGEDKPTRPELARGEKP